MGAHNTFLSTLDRFETFLNERFLNLINGIFIKSLKDSQKTQRKINENKSN